MEVDERSCLLNTRHSNSRLHGAFEFTDTVDSNVVIRVNIVPQSVNGNHDTESESSPNEEPQQIKPEFLSKITTGKQCSIGVSHIEHEDSGHLLDRNHQCSGDDNQNYDSNTQPTNGETPKQDSKNSSLVTVFAIWNAMMGTSLLAMPWLVLQCGLVMAVFVFVGMTAVCMFTAYTVLTAHTSLRLHDLASNGDFSCVMRRVLSKRSYQAGVLFSICVMIGAMLVYWVLMSDFLYHSVEMFLVDDGPNNGSSANITYIHGAFCPSSAPIHLPTFHFNSTVEGNSLSTYTGVIWSRATAAIFLAILLFPLMNIKNPTFFAKFTGLGTVSVMYILVFITTKAAQFGVNVDFTETNSNSYVFTYRPTFPAAMGTLSMALFIHNCVCDIMKTNRHSENNVRDLLSAYTLVFATYFYIGIIFFISWPLHKNCIQENLLDNFNSSDTLAVIGRWCLLFQLSTVFPLLGCMVRDQLMTFLFGLPYPTLPLVCVLNACVVTLSVVVAVFYPHIGQLTRFSGSLCGLAWIFAFPSLVYIVGKRKFGQRLSRFKVVLHGSIILLGLINFILQFVISPR